MSRASMDGAPPKPDRRPAAAELLRSAYDWESDRETLTLGDAVQRFRDVNGYVGLPIPAKPAFLKVFRRLINGRRPPEEIYRVHDASHVLTGTTFTHDEPPLVLLAGEAVEQGFYFASRGTPRAVGWVLFYGGAFVECARRIASVPPGVPRHPARPLQPRLRLRAPYPAHQPVHHPGGRALGPAGGRGAPAPGHAGGSRRRSCIGIPIPPKQARRTAREWEGFERSAVRAGRAVVNGNARIWYGRRTSPSAARAHLPPTVSHPGWCDAVSCWWTSPQRRDDRRRRHPGRIPVSSYPRRRGYGWQSVNAPRPAMARGLTIVSCAAGLLSTIP